MSAVSFDGRESYEKLKIDCLWCYKTSLDSIDWHMCLVSDIHVHTDRQIVDNLNIMNGSPGFNENQMI